MKKENKPIPNNPELYQLAKEKVSKRYKSKRSPFLSGAIVQEYKKLGGSYKGDKSNTKLSRWFDEKWVGVNPMVGKENYVYEFFRPTVKVSERTGTLLQDISKNKLSNLVDEKQKSKYDKNVKEKITGKGAKVLMDKKDFLNEHKKLINLLKLGKKLTDEAEEQEKEVKNTQYIGGMIVKSQPYSKGRFDNFN
jgi:hypothetical protein